MTYHGQLAKVVRATENAARGGPPGQDPDDLARVSIYERCSAGSGLRCTLSPLHLQDMANSRHRFVDRAMLLLMSFLIH